MKKRVTLIIIGAVVILSVVAYFIPVNNPKQVAIKASMINTFTELNSPKEWQRWHPGIANACKDSSQLKYSVDSAHKSFNIQLPSGSIDIANNAFAFVATEKTGLLSSEECSYALIPTMHDDTTIVVYNEQKNLLQTILPFFDNKLNNYDVADSLKSFMETPSKLYGFPLKRVPVIDTNVVVTYNKCLVKDRAVTLNAMYKKLHDYIDARHLQITQPNMVYYHDLPHDSMEIKAAIPVNKIADSTKDISCLTMPKGHMLVGYYKGSFGGRVALYKAMDKYIQGGMMKVVASSYEKYLDNKVPENDTSQVEMELYYPILY